MLQKVIFAALLVILSEGAKIGFIRKRYGFRPMDIEDIHTEQDKEVVSELEHLANAENQEDIHFNQSLHVQNQRIQKSSQFLYQSIQVTLKSNQFLYLSIQGNLKNSLRHVPWKIPMGNQESLEG